MDERYLPDIDEDISDKTLNQIANNGESILKNKFETERSIQEMNDYLRGTLLKLKGLQGQTNGNRKKVTVCVFIPEEKRDMKVKENIGLVISFLEEVLIKVTSKDDPDFKKAYDFRLISTE